MSQNNKILCSVRLTTPILGEHVVFEVEPLISFTNDEINYRELLEFLLNPKKGNAAQFLQSEDGTKKYYNFLYKTKNNVYKALTPETSAYTIYTNLFGENEEEASFKFTILEIKAIAGQPLLQYPNQTSNSSSITTSTSTSTGTSLNNSINYSISNSSTAQLIHQENLLAIISFIRNNYNDNIYYEKEKPIIFLLIQDLTLLEIIQNELKLGMTRGKIHENQKVIRIQMNNLTVQFLTELEKNKHIEELELELEEDITLENFEKIKLFVCKSY
ncbi:hypothetical protein ABK040_008531 [Willaertia magna]